MSFTVRSRTKQAAQSERGKARSSGKDTADSGGSNSKNEEEKELHPFFAAAANRAKRRRDETPNDTSTSTSTSTAEAEGGTEGQLHVVSYNVDGLDDNLLRERASEICSIVLGEQQLPDAVLLQEVVPEIEQMFIRRFEASGYRAMVTGVRDETSPYFTQIFVKDRPGLVFENMSVRQEFESSQMGRDCCMVSGTLHGEPITIATAHFESLSQYSNERKAQFAWVLAQMKAFDGLFVFGGDTNLREAEVKATKQAKEVSDAWVDAGSNKDTRFTWDLAINTNKQMDTPSQPRARYDRIFFSKSPRYRVSKFQLLGTEKMAEGMFPSDHFGIDCVLRVRVRKLASESSSSKRRAEEK